jgi:hypothetical protein
MGIDDMRLDDETDEFLAAAAAEKNKKAEKAGKTKKGREPFVIISKTQFDILGMVANATTMVLLHLMFLDFKARGKSFKFSNDTLSEVGVNRYAKQRALNRLEELGWISVERICGKEPVITIARQPRATNLCTFAAGQP